MDESFAGRDPPARAHDGQAGAGSRAKRRAVEAAEEGAKAFDKVLRKWPGVTAVAGSSDVLAAGVMMHCQTLGISIPDQMSVIGFQDLEFIGTLRPALTTVHVPAVEMGRLAARAASGGSMRRCR